MLDNYNNLNNGLFGPTSIGKLVKKQLITKPDPNSPYDQLRKYVTEKYAADYVMFKDNSEHKKS